MASILNANMNSKPNFAEDIRKKEYEVQLYGYTVDEIFAFFRSSLEDSFNKLVEDLIKKLSEDKMADVEKVSAAHEGLINLWKGASSSFYEELEKVVKEYFEIPSHVLLPEDKVHILSHTIEKNEELDKELNELTKQLKSVKMMKQCLELENLTLKKLHALERELSESGVLESCDIDIHNYESTLQTQMKQIMKILYTIDVNRK